jgi:hypothetical protein
MTSGCCGQPSPRRIRAAKEGERLPRNPQVSDGVNLLFLGSGRKDFTGSVSNLKYVVSDHRRSFVVHAEDVSALLKKRFVILAP